MKSKPKTIDEYLADVPAEQRADLETLRRTIHAAAPGVEECISYGLAGFRLNGRFLVAFGAWKQHSAFYPASPATQEQFQDQLKDFIASKGTVRFTHKKPLPPDLVTQLVQARVAENAKLARPRRRVTRSRPKAVAGRKKQPVTQDQTSGKRRSDDARGKLSQTDRHKSKQKTP